MLWEKVRVRNYSHITGEYRNSNPQTCNVNFQSSKKILFIFHNLRRYDGHLIMQETG